MALKLAKQVARQLFRPKSVAATAILRCRCTFDFQLINKSRTRLSLTTQLLWYWANAPGKPPTRKPESPSRKTSRACGHPKAEIAQVPAFPFRWPLIDIDASATATGSATETATATPAAS